MCKTGPATQISNTQPYTTSVVATCHCLDRVLCVIRAQVAQKIYIDDHNPMKSVLIHVTKWVVLCGLRSSGLKSWVLQLGLIYIIKQHL